MPLMPSAELKGSSRVNSSILLVQQKISNIILSSESEIYLTNAAHISRVGIDRCGLIV